MVAQCFSRRGVVAGLPALPLAVLPGAPTARQTSDGDAFDVALAAFKAAWRDYSDACYAGAADQLIDDLQERVSHAGLALLQAPVTNIRHVRALLEVGHEHLFPAEGYGELSPQPHVPVDDALLTNWDKRNRAFIELAIRALAKE